MWSPHRVSLLMNIISLCLKNVALNKKLIDYSSEVLDMERTVLSKNCFKDMLGTKSLYPSLHWQKETTATKTTWGQVRAARQPGPGAGRAAGLGSVLSSKESNSPTQFQSFVLTKLQLSKGLCSCHQERAETPPWPWALARKWCLLEQDEIGRHWCVWQGRGQALPWAELLFQVSHHREESGLKCRDTAESVVCAAPVSALTAPNLTAPQKWHREHSKTAMEVWALGFPQAPDYTLNVLHPWLLLITPKAT